MHADTSSLPALVLAAGLSSRMNAFKPLLPLAGKPLILHSLETLHASGVIAPLLVVTGHRAADLQQALPPYARPVFNPHYATGEMLSSLQAGICALSAQTPPAFLLALADQPAVRVDTLRTLVQAFFDSPGPPPPLVMPNYLGKKGHPVVISWALVPAIQSLPPDDTLRSVVHQHLPQARMMTVNDPSVVEDLDTPEQFLLAQQRLSQTP